MFKRIQLAGALVLATASAVAQPIYTPGTTYYDSTTNQYVEYVAGNCPVVITSPHGGDKSPSSIPDRANGTYNGVTYNSIVTANDANTQDLARKIAAEIYNRTGRRPHLIISRLARIKLDPNRDIGEAALGNAAAEAAWTAYHNFIRDARQTAETQGGFAFLTDIHGHGHTIQRLELGYNYDDELDFSDTVLSHPGFALKSSINTLAIRRPGVPFPTILRGAGSIGDIFNALSVPAWPSPDFPSPGTNEFFDGGYTTRAQSCFTDNSLSNAVQIESYNSGLRDTDANRAAYATKIAQALHIFLYNQFGYALGTQPVTQINSPASSVFTRGGTPITLTVARSGNLTGNLAGTTSTTATVALTYGGNATLGTDFSGPTSLTFNANQSTATLTLTPSASTSSVGDKVVTVALAPTGTQTADSTPLTLTLGDGSSQTVRVQTLAASVAEGAGTATFRFTRSQTVGALTVPVTWTGTAQIEADYFNAPSSVTFADGAASVDAVVSLVDDGRAEPDKTLIATLGTGSGYIVGAQSSATLTIRDDDRPAGLALWLRGDIANNVATDSSGNARHGTALPADQNTTLRGPQPDTPVNGLPAIIFDGTDDTVVTQRFNPASNGEMTIAFFFKLQTHTISSSNQSLMSFGETRSAIGTVQVALSSTTNLRTYLSDRTTSALDITLSSSTSQDGVTWRHYALTVAADGTARVYLNGVLQKTSPGTPIAFSTSELFWLGWSPSVSTIKTYTSGLATAATNSPAFMRGSMRDFRVYQRALSATEITALSNNVQNYSAWLAQNSLATSTAATSDADANGFPAIFEYGLGARPAIANVPPRYSVTIENSKLVLRFLRDTAATDLTWTVQASTDLGTWQTIASRTGVATNWTMNSATVTETNGFVTVTDSVTIGTQPGRFLRLQISSP